MGSGSYKQVDVQCPFYRNDDAKLKLRCEGVVDGSTLTWNFPKKVELKKQMDLFCCKNYRACEVYRMLMEAKYDE